MSIPGVVASQLVTEAAPQTATPTIGTPYCLIIENRGQMVNHLYVSFKNEDDSTATAYVGGFSKGSVGAGNTINIELAAGFTLNYNYNYNFTAQASGKDESAVVNRSGTISFCQMT